MKSYKYKFFIFCCGALLALLFPPFLTGFFASIAVVPLFYFLKNSTPYEGFVTGYIWGLGWACTTVFWVTLATVPGGIALCFYVPLFSGLFSMTVSYGICKQGRIFILWAPFIWVMIEFLQEHTDLAFPWLTFGYTQTYYIPVIQFASFTSVYGVSFILLLLNVCIYLTIEYFRERSLIYIKYSLITVFLFSAPYIYGKIVLSGKPEYKSIKASVIQANISTNDKWAVSRKQMNFNKMRDMTYAACKDISDVIIWPETATANYIRFPYVKKYKTQLHSLVNDLNTPLLTGTLDQRYIAKFDTSRPFNSAVLFKPGSKHIEWYNKLKLVPFSERVPFEDLFPFLQRLEMGEADFYPGSEYTVFYLPKSVTGLRKNNPGVSIMICYDSIFTEVGRQFVKNGADFLVIITNDSWFGRTSAPYQHAQYAVFRAVENRVGIARCGNTGVSCFIDPYGRVSRQTAIFQEAIITGNVKLMNKASFFNNHGHIFTYIICCLAIIGILQAIPEQKQK